MFLSIVIARCSDADGLGLCSGAAKTAAIEIIRLAAGKAKYRLFLFI